MGIVYRYSLFTHTYSHLEGNFSTVRALNTVFLGGLRKPENLEKQHTDMGENLSVKKKQKKNPRSGSTWECRTCEAAQTLILQYNHVWTEEFDFIVCYLFKVQPH